MTRWGPLPRVGARVGALVGALVGVLATGCEDGGDGTRDPAPTPTAACDTSPVEAGGWRVAQCRASRALELTSVDGVVLTGVMPALTLDGDDGAIDAWPVVVWRAGSDGGTLRLHDDARATVTLDLRLAERCVEAAVTVEVAAPAEVALSLWTVESGRIGDRGSIDAPATPRPAPRVVVGAGAAVMAGGIDPAWPLEVGGVDRMALARSLSMTPGAPFTATLGVCSGADEATARAAFAALVATHHPRPTGAAPLGWRVDAAADALADNAALLAEWVERPTVVLDGAWYAGRGDWSPAAQFPDGIRAALPPGVDVAVIWPGLRVAADGPVAAEHPDWLDADCRADCPTLDPRIPGVRDHLAREALALAARGLRPIITGLPADPDRARALLAALPEPVTLDVFETSPPPPLGLSPAVGLFASDALRDIGAALEDHIWMRRIIAIEVERLRLLDRPPGQARQLAALALLAGVRLIDDPPLALADDERGETARALLTAPTIGDPRPQPAPQIPSGRARVWRGDDALVIFNWSDAALTLTRPVELAPELAGAAPLFAASGHDPLGDAAEVTIPPDDVVVWVTVDADDADR